MRSIRSFFDCEKAIIKFCYRRFICERNADVFITFVFMRAKFDFFDSIFRSKIVLFATQPIIPLCTYSSWKLCIIMASRISGNEYVKGKSK